MTELAVLQRTLEPTPASTLAPGHGTRELPLDELEICHLRTADDIRRVLHLRSQIPLPAAALADPDFHTREKKETRPDSSPDSAGADSSSARSASFRWAAASHPARSCC